MVAHKAPAGDCLVCGYPMRHQGEPAREGVRIRRAEGLCIPCHYRATKSPAAPPKPTISAETIALARDWMDDYTADRRRRRVPYEGVVMPGESHGTKLPGNRWTRPEEGEDA